MTTSGRAAPAFAVALWSCLACSNEPPPEAYDYLNIFGTAGYERECGFATDRIALDEQTPLGFRASDVLDWAATEHRTTMTWAFSAEATTVRAASDVTFAIESLGKARWVRGAGENPWGFEVSCGANLLLDVHLAISTSDGRVNEELDTALVVGSADVAMTEILLTSPPPYASFGEALPVLEPGAYESLRLHLTLSPYATYGRIEGPWDPDRGSLMARFPSPDPCPYGEVAIDEIPAVSAEARARAIERLNATSPLPVQPEGTELRLAFEDTGGQACAELGRSGIAQLSFPGSATLTSSDGRLDGQLPVVISTDPEDSEYWGAMASDEAHLADPVQAAATATSFGIMPPLDFSPYPAQAVYFLHRVGQGTASGGLLAVGGVAPPPCTPRFDDDFILCEADEYLFDVRWATSIAP